MCANILIATLLNFVLRVPDLNGFVDTIGREERLMLICSTYSCGYDVKIYYKSDWYMYIGIILMEKFCRKSLTQPQRKFRMYTITIDYFC